MLQSKSVSANASRFDARIIDLEEKLLKNPENANAAQALLTILDFYLPSQMDLGVYTKCQSKLASQLQEHSWIDEIHDPDKASEFIKNWQSILHASDVNTRVPVFQLYAGEILKVQGVQARCPKHLSLFKEQRVISRICHDCYKVQILPLDLTAFIQTYFVIRHLKLPRNNTRKCMIELREDIPNPYKGYIYGDSEEEVEFCLAEFQKALQTYQIRNVHCGISHGCSEYGLQYPEFKYSADGSHRSFKRPPSWDQLEDEYFSGMELNPSPRKNYDKDCITVRDIIAFRTWIQYAEFIGDDEYLKYRNVHETSNPPSQFAMRVRKQAQQRKDQMKDLRERSSAKA